MIQDNEWASDETMDYPTDYSTVGESWADVLRYGFKRAVDAQIARIDPPQNTKPEVKSLNVPQNNFAGLFGSADGAGIPQWVWIAGAVLIAMVVLPKLMK